MKEAVQILEPAVTRPKSFILTGLLITFYRNVENSSFPRERPQTILLGDAVQAKPLYTARDRAKELSVSSTVLLEHFGHQKSGITAK